MKWLLINYEFPPLGGGAGVATQSFARELAGLGHEVTVLTTRLRNQPERELADGYLVLRVRCLRRKREGSNPLEMISFLLAAAIRVVGLEKDLRPRITLAFFGVPSGPVAWLAKTLWGAPYIVMLRGGDIPGCFPEQSFLAQEIARPVVRWVWENACLVLANSNGKKELAEAAGWGIPIGVLPNGVDTEIFKPGSGGGRSETVQLLFVGRISVVKGLDYLLKALWLLEKEHNTYNWRLDIIGEGPAKGMLSGLAQSLGIADKVRFPGWMPREEIARVYPRADLFILPSLDEGMPNALLEAMASGLASVVTRVPGSSELVDDGEEGVVVAPADAQALARALHGLIKNTGLRERMGENARKKALSLSWRDNAHNLVKKARLQFNPEKI